MVNDAYLWIIGSRMMDRSRGGNGTYNKFADQL